MTDPVLVGRVALVTGASRGIGAAIAAELAARGARVALVARSESALAEVAAGIRSRGGDAVAVVADLAAENGAAAALAATIRAFGPVEVLVNNAAAVGPLGLAARIRPEEYAAALRLGVAVPAELSFAVAPGMIERGWGRIVNISSGVAVRPEGMVGGNAYATAKAALEAQTVNLAAELAGTGVTVNAFRPGRVDTEMQRVLRESDPEVVGAALVERFRRSFEEGELIPPERSAADLIGRLSTDATGRLWRVGDP